MCGYLVLKEAHPNTTLLAPGTPTGACLLPGVSLVRDLQVCSQRHDQPKALADYHGRPQYSMSPGLFGLCRHAKLWPLVPLLATAPPGHPPVSNAASCGQLLNIGDAPCVATTGANRRPVGIGLTIVMSPVTSNGCDSSCSCSPSVSLISIGGGWRWRRWAISMWLLLQPYTPTSARSAECLTVTGDLRSNV